MDAGDQWDWTTRRLCSKKRRMNKLFPILLIATVTPFCVQGQQSGGTLTGTLASQGLAGAKL